MKARVKKLGLHDPATWVRHGVLYDVVQHNPETAHVFEHFYVIVPGYPATVQCLVHNCSTIGGGGAEWELIKDIASDNDAYDRAMSVL